MTDENRLQDLAGRVEALERLMEELRARDATSGLLKVSSEDGRGRLVFRSPSGKPLFIVTESAEGTVLSLQGIGDGRVLLMAGTEGAAVSGTNTAGKARFGLRAEESGFRFSLIDDGGTMAHLQSEYGKRSLVLYRRTGKAGCVLAENERSYCVTLCNEEGDPSLSLGSGATGGFIFIADRRGNPVGLLRLTEDGARLLVQDRHNVIRASVPLEDGIDEGDDATEAPGP